MLQLGDELVTVQRHHPVVVVTGDHERRRVRRPVAQPMQW